MRKAAEEEEAPGEERRGEEACRKERKQQGGIQPRPLSLSDRPEAECAVAPVRRTDVQSRRRSRPTHTSTSLLPTNSTIEH